ncbi:Vacuolar protein sorting-associated [Trichoderma ghanense]|uniref:Vacuolar protein sorting-associated protein 51 homolog n=1 Tax=Trichoderma ghanense TaxID=65468 RepID=A0ABY2HGJ9_9HYPO
MSTIASSRNPPAPLRRTPSGTPTSSARPSFDVSRSAVTSPVLSASQPATTTTTTGSSKRSNNRAALREYYNLRAAAASASASTPSTPRIVEAPDSEVPASEIDAPDFNLDDYLQKVVAESSLQELLKLYTRVLGEVRALDAEKKALVYDNYSKLITATETIRKMRANMDPLNPMATTLDPAIAHIYSQASAIQESLRKSVPAPDSEEGKAREAQQRRQRTRQLAIEVLATPERLQALVREGRFEEARRQWEMPRKLLEVWKQKGVGGDDVQACIDQGDAAIALTRSRSPAPEASRDGRYGALVSPTPPAMKQ